MYKLPTRTIGTLNVNNSVEGDTIENKIFKATSLKQPLDQSGKLLYTERKQGVLAETDIRTDRFAVAIDATDKIAKSYSARREERHKPKEEPKVGEPESTAGKVETTPQ